MVKHQSETLIQRDLQHFWHPGSQMKDYESFPPLPIVNAQGAYLYTASGQPVIDAFSSWWCKSLGHGHPRLREALQQQAKDFEHVILANTTNEPVVALSEKLAGLTDTLNKAFYVGDGSCATEVALKMSLQTRPIQGKPDKTKFATLQNSYHGETAGALSVSDVTSFKQPYQAMLFDSQTLGPLPYVSGPQDPLWYDCSDYWPAIQGLLDAHSSQLTALIVEPVLQGAGGLRVYSQDLLRRLRVWCNQNDVHLIADEIMTGIGRTGQWLACQHAGVEPDMACLSKGLTSGWLAFSAVLTTDAIYDHFYGEHSVERTFGHSHTYSGNPLGARLALETLRVMEDEQTLTHVERLTQVMAKHFTEIAQQTGLLTNIRHLGAMVAGDIVGDPRRRMGDEVFQKAVALGALLRPLGNTIYWMPPLNTSLSTLDELKAITTEALQSVANE